MAYYSVNMRSEYLKGNETVGIIMPDKPRTVEPSDFYSRNVRYKVLWLLHGGLGDYSDWIRKSNIERYACENDLIVVMPSAMNSQYMSWDAYAVGYDMRRFLTNELMPMIYGWLPASEKKEDNYLAGISMGGSGALKYALNSPEKFAAAAVLSWAPYDIDDVAEAEKKHQVWLENELAACGGLDAWKGSRDDTWRLTGELAGKEHPKMYFAMGEKDEMAPRFERYRRYAGDVGFQAEFHVVPGYAHEWKFWDLEIQKVLSFFGIENGGRGNAF